MVSDSTLPRGGMTPDVLFKLPIQSRSASDANWLPWATLYIQSQDVFPPKQQEAQFSFAVKSDPESKIF